MEKFRGVNCNECGRSFVNRSNLRKHVKTFHPDKLNELAPKYLQTSSNFSFTCKICAKNFNHKKHLNFHLKTHNINEVVTASREDCKKCPLCEYKTSKTQNIHAHFTENHDISIVSENITFSTLDEFYNWKTQVESESNSKFVKHTATSKTQTMYTYYICHRSGKYNPKGKGLRCLKLNGSNKINAFCPSRVTVVLDDDKYKVNFIKTHVGHQNDLGHLTLSQSERKLLAHKIASKIPFDTIIDEVVANSMPTSSSDLKRINLLTRKDMHNIESCKIRDICHRHKNSLLMDTNIVTKTSNGWEVASGTGYKIYFIQEATKICDCKLICTECSICIHNYTCSCIDSSIKYNICKHIHLLAQWSKKNAEKCTDNISTVDNQALAPSQDCDDKINHNGEESDDNCLYIHSTPGNETRNILLEVGHKSRNHSVEDEKTKLMQNFQEQLDKIHSPTKLAIVKRCIASLSPILAAASSDNGAKLPKPISHPPNAKISVQRKLWSTKNKIKKPNDSLKRLTTAEKEQTAVLLLNTAKGVFFQT